MPASRALRKLSAHHPESRLYKALREVGRIEKTLFLLDYISDLALRRRVLVGLNKGESYQALARSLVIALGGILRSRSIDDQVNQITCLRLLAILSVGVSGSRVRIFSRFRTGRCRKYAAMPFP